MRARAMCESVCACVCVFGCVCVCACVWAPSDIGTKIVQPALSALLRSPGRDAGQFGFVRDDLNKGRVAVEGWVNSDVAKELFANAGLNFEQAKIEAAKGSYNIDIPSVQPHEIIGGAAVDANNHAI